jgi:hypothetical protein
VTRQPIDEEVLRNYLLGASSETETERLDDLSITDDEVASRLSAVENELVDAYVRGELSEDELARFNSHYLASPIRRDKVTFSKTFLAFADAAANVRAEEIDPIAPESKWLLGKLPGRSFFAVPHLALLWGLTAAALIFLLAGGYLVLDNLRLRNQMTQTQADRATLQQREQELQRQLDEQRSADAETMKELKQVRESLAQLEQRLAANQQGARAESQSPLLSTVSFVLAPQTRGVGQIATIAVPAGTDYVALTLQLESEGFPKYQGALKDPATNQIVWQSGKLGAISSGKSKAISIKLRANLLKPNNYSIELTGIPRNGPPEIIGSYSFKVVLQ